MSAGPIREVSAETLSYMATWLVLTWEFFESCLLEARIQTARLGWDFPFRKSSVLP